MNARPLHLALSIAGLVLIILKLITFGINPDERVLSTFLKAGIGIVAVLLALIPKGLHNRETKYLFAVLLVFIVADLLMKWVFPLGGGFFTLGHCLLIVIFRIMQRPSRKLLLVGGIVGGICAAAVFCIVHFTTHYGLLLALGLAVYSVMLVYMVALSLNMHPMLKLAAWFFVLSDLLLLIDKLAGSTLIHLISAFFYYLVYGLISEYIYRNNVKGVSENLSR